MRFGTSLHTSADLDPAAEARHAEEMGFDLVTVMDHLPGTRPSLETWTALTWAGAATSRILVGTNVLGLPYRNPAVTAKMAESLHRLTRGRLVLGLGAGGTNEEFRAFGLPVRDPGEKISAFEEALAIIRGLLAGETLTSRGRHYVVDGAVITPTADPPVPIWLGTYGERALALTGQLADGWLPSMRFAPPERYPALRDRVRRAAEGSGRDPDTFEYAYNVGVRVDERAEPREHVVSGPPGRVAEGLAGLARLGVTFPVLWAIGDQAEQRQRLATEVFPEVRRGVP